MHVEIFIKTVKDYPLLYNSNLPEYKDSALRNDAWNEISKTVGLPPDDCRAKWARLRNCFTNALHRQRKKSINSMPSVTWRYQPQMAFLIPYIEAKTLSNVTIDMQDQYDIRLDEFASDDENGHSKKRFKQEESASHDEEENGLHFEEVAMHMPPNKVYTISTPSHTETDETDLFFLSMSKQLKRLPKVDQARIKFELHKAIHNVEMKMYSTDS